MRRFALLIVPVSAILAGCPIWDDDYYGDDYYCDEYYDDCYGGSSGARPGSYCNDQDDCYVGEICSAAGVCTTDSCSQVGCAYGAECVIRDGVAQCVDYGNGSSSSGGSSGGPIGECRVAADCPVAGSKCLNNECVTPEEQCVDSTQCKSDQRCVEGVCTNQCETDSDCPIGYGCDETLNVCTENPQPCSETQPCPDGTCVGDRCVQSCTEDSECPEDLVCRFGGCVVDPTPSFYCAVTGELGDGSPGKCASGSICLRGSCYIACDPAATDSCRAADEFNQCKPVSTGGETYHVCGSEENLGSECDVAGGNPCADPNDVCVDGYCL